MTDQTMNPKPHGTTADTVKGAASDVAATATSAARDAYDAASEEVSTRAEGAKTAAADEVKSIAHALRTAADELREGSPQERTFSQIAHGLADASEAIRGKDMGEMAGDISDYARRNPLVFLGGAALVGFALTRFAKATSEPAGYTTSSASMSGMTSRPGYGTATRGGTSTSPATGKVAPDHNDSRSSTGFEAPRPVGTPASPMASPAVSTTRTGEL